MIQRITSKGLTGKTRPLRCSETRARISKPKNEGFFAEPQEVSSVRIEILSSSQIRSQELKLSRRLAAYRQSSYWVAAMAKLVEFSIARTWDQAKLEWRLAPRAPVKYNPEGQKCALHQADIHWVYSLVNLRSRRRIEVGPECVAVHALPGGAKKISKERVALQREIGELGEDIQKLEKGLKRSQLEETRERKIDEMEELEDRLFRLQIKEAKAAKRNLLKDIRAKNSEFLMKKGSQLMEMLDALFKYRGILLREDSLGKARELIPKLIRNTQGAIRTIQAARNDFIYFHDIDLQKIKELYAILLTACPVLQVHPGFEKKMRGLWNHRKAEIEGVKIFSEEERTFIEEVHERWEKDVTEIAGEYPLSIPEADRLVKLFGQLRKAGFMFKEEILKEHPRFGYALAQLYRNLDKLSPENQAVVKGIISAWGRDDLTELKGVKKLLNFKPKTYLSLEDQEAIKGLIAARIAHAEVRRFAKFIEDKWERDGIFTEEEITGVRKLYQELRKSYLPKEEILKGWEGFEKRLAELEDGKIFLTNEEGEYIERLGQEWREVRAKTFSRIAAQKLMDLHQRLTSKAWTLTAIQKVYSDFGERVGKLRIKRKVLTPQGIRERANISLFFELLPDPVKNFVQRLVLRTKAECRHFKFEEVQLVLQIFSELDKNFLSFTGLKPDLQKKITYWVNRRWGRSEAEEKLLDWNSFRALIALGYIQRENIEKIEGSIIYKDDDLGRAIDARLGELSSREIPPSYRYLLAELRENWQTYGYLFKETAERLLSERDLTEAIEENEKEVRRIREEAAKTSFRSGAKMVERLKAARDWGRVGKDTTNLELAKEAIGQLTQALGDFWYYKKEERWINAISQEAILQLELIAKASEQKRLLVEEALEKAKQSPDEKIKQGAKKASASVTGQKF